MRRRVHESRASTASSALSHPDLRTSSANVALPTLAEAFDASFQQVQWVVLACLLATTTSIVGVGRLGDLTGRRRLLMGGIFLFTAASGLCGIASELWLLLVARAVQGLGAAVMMALTLAFVGDLVPKARIGSAMGLLGTMSAAGTALGPSLGGILIAGFGWRGVFFVNVPPGIVALVLAYRWLPVDPRRTTAVPTRFDVPGTLLLALTLAAWALAMTIGHGRFGPVNLALLGAAVLGAGLFVRAEARPSPLVRLSELRDPVPGAGLATSALVSTVMMAMLVVGPFYLERALGLDPALVGIVLSVGPGIALLTGVPAGRSVDRFGTQRTTVVGLGGMGGGCVALCLAPTATGIAGFVVPVALLTAGYALVQAANNTAVLTDLSPDRRGVVSGLLVLSRYLGLVTGVAAMGAVFAFASGTSDVATAPPEAVAVGMRVTMAAAAGLVGVALVIARSRRSDTVSVPLVRG